MSSTGPLGYRRVSQYFSLMTRLIPFRSSHPIEQARFGDEKYLNKSTANARVAHVRCIADTRVVDAPERKSTAEMGHPELGGMDVASFYLALLRAIEAGECEHLGRILPHIDLRQAAVGAWPSARHTSVLEGGGRLVTPSGVFVRGALAWRRLHVDPGAPREAFLLFEALRDLL